MKIRSQKNLTGFMSRQGCHIVAVHDEFYVVEYGGRRWSRVIENERDASDWMNHIESTLCRENAPAARRA